MLGKIGIFNESFFWVMSWLRENTTGKNYREAHEKLSNNTFDYVLNISNTVPIECDAWWIQGSPLDMTLEKLASSNNFAKILRLVFGGLIGKFDRSLLKKYSTLSPKWFFCKRECSEQCVTVQFKQLRGSNKTPKIHYFHEFVPVLARGRL